MTNANAYLYVAVKNFLKDKMPRAFYKCHDKMTE